MSNQIQAVLRHYPLDRRQCAIRSLGSAGGFSGAMFWRIGSPDGDLVLRRWPREHPTPEQLQYIHDTLNHAARRGIDCLPVPIVTNGGASFVQDDGHFWELAPWLPGNADFYDNPSPAKLAAALAMLARFHLAAGNGELNTFAPAVVERFERLMQLNQRALESMNHSLNESIWPTLVEPARKFLALVPNVLIRIVPPIAKMSNVRVPVQPCIRDIWHDHVLFTGDRVTGIVDFGAMRADTPAVDVARLLGSLAGDDVASWQAGLEAYKTVRSLSQNELSCASALDSAGIVLAGCNWIRWIYGEQRRFEHTMEIESRFGRLLCRLRYLANFGPTAGK